jgi:hypothetical protein
LGAHPWVAVEEMHAAAAAAAMVLVAMVVVVAAEVGRTKTTSWHGGGGGGCNPRQLLSWPMRARSCRHYTVRAADAPRHLALTQHAYALAVLSVRAHMIEITPSCLLCTLERPW